MDIRNVKIGDRVQWKGHSKLGNGTVVDKMESSSNWQHADNLVIQFDNGTKVSFHPSWAVPPGPEKEKEAEKETEAKSR